eukprot:5011135-Pleurochrysis_carterae.AAC.1
MTFCMRSVPILYPSPHLSAYLRYVISCHDECQYNPWRILPCLERALATYVVPMGDSAKQKAEAR